MFMEMERDKEKRKEDGQIERRRIFGFIEVILLYDREKDQNSQYGGESKFG
jgi:hypothetical protein